MGALPAGPARTALLIGIATALLVFQVYVAMSFGLILKPMSADLGMSAATASAVSAIFMLAGFLLQLPAGIAVDRYRPGRVLALATLVCVAGILLLAVAPSAPLAFAGRLVMGFGSAFAFVGALKIVGLVVPPARFGLWVGIWQVLYSLAVAALAYATNALDAEQAWRVLMYIMAAAGIGVAALLWLADAWLPPPDGADNAGGRALWQRVRETAVNREILLAAILFALTFGPVLAYSDLWAVPNQLAFGNSAAMAAGIAGMIPIGVGVGSLAVGWLADRTGRPAGIGAATAAVGLAAILALVFLPPLPGWGAAALTFLLGVGSAASVTALAYARRFAGPAQIGTAIGLLSAAGNLGGGLLQVEIGALLDLRGAGGTAEIGGFEASLSPLLFCFALAIALFAVLRPEARPSR